MPIPVYLTTAPPPPRPPVPPPLPPPVILGLKHLVWGDPDGVEWLLSDWTTGIACSGVVGIGKTPTEPVWDDLPGGGAVMRQVRSLPRNVTADLWLWSDVGQIEQRERLRRFTESLDPTRPGRLAIVWPDGERRYLDPAYYLGEVDGDESLNAMGPLWQRLTPRWVALDPAWKGAVQRGRFETGGGSTSLFPLLPLNLAPSQLLETATLTNPGSEPAHIRWWIRGPTDGMTLGLRSTGESFTIDRQIADDLVYVDTVPTAQEITLNPGAEDALNLWPDLTLGSMLWSLPRGTHELDLTLVGAVAGRTRVDYEFVPRHDWH